MSPHPHLGILYTHPVPPCVLHSVPGGVGGTREGEDPDRACKGLAVPTVNPRSHTLGYGESLGIIIIAVWGKKASSLGHLALRATLHLKYGETKAQRV